MKVISTPRGGGKTTKLVYDLLENPRAVMVVSTSQRKSQMRPVVEMVVQRRIALPGATGSALIDEVMERVLTCDDIRKTFGLGQRLLRDRSSRVLVDDLEDVLHYFLGADVAVATTSFLPDLVGG